MYLALVHFAFGDAVVINYIIHFTFFLQQVEGNLIGAIPNSVYNRHSQLCSYTSLWQNTQKAFLELSLLCQRSSVAPYCC